MLSSVLISITTKETKRANKIFEILNAKGKNLTYIDLIKNKIFELLEMTEPVDIAEDKWNKIKSALRSRNENVGFATFYRHFWVSKYKRSLSTKMYDDFLRIIPKTKEEYLRFLDDMLIEAEYYMKIIKPNRQDFQNRKEYFWLVQSMNIISNTFNIVQVRIALIALMFAKEKGIIDFTSLNNATESIEHFHFAYNSLLKNSTNALERIYANFAQEIRKCTSKSDAKYILNDKLLLPLKNLFPNKEEFINAFINLNYSKSDHPDNLKSKYAINKINSYKDRIALFSDQGTIEHILPENESICTLNIGNLILLEETLNGKSENFSYLEKKPKYLESNYTWVKEFVGEYEYWDSSMIEKRSLKMAEYLYEKIKL